jgi:hypothetical protein
MLTWFDTAEVDAFVDRTIADLRQRIPPASLNDEGRKGAKAGAKFEKAHDNILRDAQTFARQHRPNFYKKARLANRFKWGLLAAGYSKDFVDAFAIKVASVVAAAGSDREI